MCLRISHSSSSQTIMSSVRYSGVEITDKDDVIKYAKKLQEQGARNVLVSMAGDGAVLVTENGQEF